MSCENGNSLTPLDTFEWNVSSKIASGSDSLLFTLVISNGIATSYVTSFPAHNLLVKIIYQFILLAYQV